MDTVQDEGGKGTWFSPLSNGCHGEPHGIKAGRDVLVQWGKGRFIKSMTLEPNYIPLVSAWLDNTQYLNWVLSNIPHT